MPKAALTVALNQSAQNILNLLKNANMFRAVFITCTHASYHSIHFFKDYSVDYNDPLEDDACSFR